MSAGEETQKIIVSRPAAAWCSMFFYCSSAGGGGLGFHSSQRLIYLRVNSSELLEERTAGILVCIPAHHARARVATGDWRGGRERLALARLVVRQLRAVATIYKRLLQDQQLGLFTNLQ